MLLFSLFVAGTYTLGHIAAPFIDATALMALRFTLSAIILGLIIVVTRPRALLQVRQHWRFLLLGSIFAVYFVAMFEALRLTSSIATGSMFTLTPFVTAGFAWLLLRQRTPGHILLWLSIAAVGALWVVFKADWRALLGFELGPGERIFLIAVLAHSLYVPLARRLNQGEPLLVFTCGVLVGGSIPLLILGLPELISIDWRALPQIVWITLGYVVVFSTLITFALMLYANQRLPGVKVMAYTYLVPGWVILWNAALGQGFPQPAIWPGIALTLLAMLMLLRDSEQ